MLSCDSDVFARAHASRGPRPLAVHGIPVYASTSHHPHIYRPIDVTVRTSVIKNPEFEIHSTPRVLITSTRTRHGSEFVARRCPDVFEIRSPVRRRHTLSRDARTARPHIHAHDATAPHTHLNYTMAPQRLPEPLLDENDNRYAMRRAGRDSNVAFESMRWRGGAGEAMARLALERARGVKSIL